MNIAEIGMAVAAPRRCADRDEHCIGAGDRIGQFGGEGQPACRHVGCDKIVEARLIDRDLAGIQRLNLRTVLVDAYRSEEHTSELPSLMRSSYAVFCLTKKTHN